MKKKNQMHPFESNETGYHRYAKESLSIWIDGVMERPFSVDDKYLFVPDVSVYENGVLKCIYEIVYSHPLDGKKLGLIEYWCYRNAVDLTIFEVSADYILKQTKKPDQIKTMECYIISQT